MTNCFIETGQITLYHYTTKKGAKQIVESGYIQESRKNKLDTDVTYGEGVYLTSLAPNTGPVYIAENNYNAGWLTALEQGRIEKAIRIRIDSSNVVVCDNRTRDVYKHPGNLYLVDVAYTVIDMPGKHLYNSGKSSNCC